MELWAQARLTAVLVLVVLVPSGSSQAAVTEQQRAKLDKLTDATQVVDQLYSGGKFVECAKKVTEIQRDLALLLSASDSSLHRLARAVYTRLGRTHGLLELEGAELEPLPSWSEMTRQNKMLPQRETKRISFAKDIAPVLMKNCTGCHIGGRRASGNFRMDTFAQFLRGGDSGTVIEKNNATESLLIKKLKGQSGQRMPAGGRPALSDEVITLISTWIQEGAVYDGPSPDTNMGVVTSQAWASDASHEELFARRRQRALRRWSRVLPNAAPASAQDENVFVLGNVPDARIRTVLMQVSEAMVQVKKLLRASSKDPVIRGGITVFVLKSRYDYSEFGRMTEGRELPKEWLGHWQADALDVYAVLSSESDIDEKQASAIALQVVAGAYLGSLGDVPTWFAEGVGRNLVARNHRRGDPRVAEWQRSLPQAVQKVENARMILENRLDEESAGLVGMALTHFMMDRSNRRRFDKLLDLLQEGKSFSESTSFAFAPPEAIIKSWLRVQ